MSHDLAISLVLISAPVAFALGITSTACWFLLNEARTQHDNARQARKALSEALQSYENERGRREVAECELANLQGKKDRIDFIKEHYRKTFVVNPLIRLNYQEDTDNA